MDQESYPVTGTYVYGVTAEETRPEEATRVLSEPPAVRSERFGGGGAPAASGVSAPPGGMARLCTKGILYRGHVARLPALFFWRSGRFLRGNPRLTAAQPVVTRPLPSDNLTMGVGLLC
jgi:hypothetical protein